eukprot:9496373-Pyramimonas_sp.AAC.1
MAVLGEVYSGYFPIWYRAWNNRVHLEWSDPLSSYGVITWAYEVCIVHLGRDLALPDLEPVFFCMPVADHAGQARHS